MSFYDFPVLMKNKSCKRLTRTGLFFGRVNYWWLTSQIVRKTGTIRYLEFRILAKGVKRTELAISTSCTGARFGIHL